MSGATENLEEWEIEMKINKEINSQKKHRIISKIILGISIVLSLLLINILSANFGEELTAAWTRGCIISFINDTILAQTVKSIIVYLLHICLRNPIRQKRKVSLVTKVMIKSILS